MTQLAKNKFLLVKHSEGWNVDRCCLWMQKTGTNYDWCYPASGQPFPSASSYDGVIVFGGASSANDCKEHAWVRDELTFIESCLTADTPFFGICLGAQMLARVMGASVSKHPQDHNEIGFCEVKPTNAGTGFLNHPLKFMQWHREGFELPSGATHLAYSELFSNQAYSVGEHVVGVQFHPEVNLDVLRIWHERNKSRPTGVLDDSTRAVHVADALECENSITQWLDSFLSDWTLAARKVA